MHNSGEEPIPTLLWVDVVQSQGYSNKPEVALASTEFNRLGSFSSSSTKAVREALGTGRPGDESHKNLSTVRFIQPGTKF